MSSPEAGPSRQPQQPRALRVSQVDADDLDDGLVSMLGEKVERALSNFRVSRGLTLLIQGFNQSRYQA
jgi:peroxin-2